MTLQLTIKMLPKNLVHLSQTVIQDSLLVQLLNFCNNYIFIINMWSYIKTISACKDLLINNISTFTK